MAVVQSAGQIVAIDRAPWPVPVGSGVSLYDGLFRDYSLIYRSQPAVRTVVAFLARNVAHLGLHLYERVSDVDRVRVTDSELARVLEQPNPFDTRFRFIDGVVHDLGIFGNAYGVKMRQGTAFGLVRVPSKRVQVIGTNWIQPEAYRLTGNQGTKDLAPEQIVHFRFYHPDDPRIGLPPLETLRQMLAEEFAAGQWREQFWNNAARQSGYIKRPPKSATTGVPKWSDEARTRFKEDWRASWSGEGPDAGGTPVLEDGMEYIAAGFSPEQAQYVESRRLGREEVAAAYFVAPPMVGILDHATLANVEEYHKQLYQDTLGPWLAMIEGDLELQLFPDFGVASPRFYAEFNLAEKLKGSFEEQADSLAKLAGAPILGRNEGRARLNLPTIDDPAFDRPVTPFNVLVGPSGNTTPQNPDTEPAGEDGSTEPKHRGAKAASAADLAYLARHTDVMTTFFEHQRRVVVSKLGVAKAVGAKAKIEEVWDDERWNAELHEDLLRAALAIAQDAGERVARQFDRDDYDIDKRGIPYLRENTRISAERVNAKTKTAVTEALESEDPTAGVNDAFDKAVGARAGWIAQGRATASANFGRHDAAEQVGAFSKTWLTVSQNPRPSHASLSGETVPIGGVFSNGGRWPGDAGLPVEEIAGCTCAVVFGEGAALSRRPGAKAELEESAPVPPPPPPPTPVEITLNVPEQKPPEVIVNVPEQKAPEITVEAPQVNVTVPELKVELPKRRTRRRVHRDKAGRISSVVDEEEDEE